MSGVVALARITPVADDGAEISRLTKAMAFRGPDGLSWQTLGQAALGCASMVAGRDVGARSLPLRLDAAPVWITADARIDAQDELRRALRQRGEQVAADACDAELILHAYLSWGADCLSHLLGDFCFVIWDERSGTLLAARDHFGVKPLFYCPLRDGLLIGNTLQALASHPEGDKGLNELFMADFLLFGESLDPGATAFAGIERLRAGHALHWSARDGHRIWRYWTLPIHEPRPARDAKSEIADFGALLKTVVRDRLRSDRVGLEFSGGMDSTSLAAMARQCLREDTGHAQMLGVCVVYDEWLPDEERHYASLAARHLEMPVKFITAEHHRLLETPQAAMTGPEPAIHMVPSLRHEVLSSSAGFSRVWLTGWDGDALLSEPLRPFLRQMVKDRRWMDLARATFSFMSTQGPLWAAGQWQRWQKRHVQPEATEQAPGFPAWLNPDLVRKHDLMARWESPPSTWKRFDNTPRPYAYQVVGQMAEDGRVFEHYDPGFHGCHLEFRHPLLDLRFVEHCLRLPVQPWCLKKHILREAMRPHLPAPVVRRPKSPLPGSPLPPLLQRDLGKVAPWPVDEKELQKFVTLDKICKQSDWLSLDSCNQRLLTWNQAGRPWLLGQWLQHRPHR